MLKQAKILLAASNLWYFGEGMLGPLFAVFAERVGGNILDIAWAWATYLIVTGVLTIVVGKFSDKLFTKEKLLVIGYGLNALFTFSYLLISKPAHLFLVQAGLGVSLALASPTWSSLYSKYEDKKKRGLIWGLASGEANICTGIAIIIGGFIVNFASFSALFITMGCIQLLAFFVEAKILKI